MSSPSSFSALVDKFRLADKENPLTYGKVAKKLGISRQFLYDLMNGDKAASEEVETRVAKALGLTVQTVHRSLGVSSMVGRS